MQSAIIMLGGVPMVDKSESIKTVLYNNENSLVAHLKKLQDGYCEGERPKIRHLTNEQGKRVIDCYCSADWHYFAIIGLRLKENSGKPIETI